MTTAVEKVVFRLRNMILHGEFRPDERIFEKTVADKLKVSRTPVRWALLTLETEGLVIGSPNRGFRVRAFSVDDVIAAYEVRAALESLAGRLAAENGVPEELWAEFDGCLAEGDDILRSAILDGEALRRWSDLNSRFHRALLAAAGNVAIDLAFNAIARIHPALPSALRYNREQLSVAHEAIRFAHAEHKTIVEALRARHASRVDYLIREHVYNSSVKFRVELERERSDAADGVHDAGTAPVARRPRGDPTVARSAPFDL